MVKCKCIDDSNKSRFIDSSEWVKKDNEYTIKFISFHPNQGNIQGCLLSEIALTEKSKPFEYYKLSRFSISIDQLPALIELAKECTKLNEFSIEELIKESELMIIENEEY